MTFWMVGVVVLFLAALAWRSQELTGPGTDLSERTCRVCGSSELPLTQGVSTDPPRAYEVYGCSHCDAATTTVHGVPSALSYCPACRQRSLELGTGRRRDGRVEVKESCPICGYHGVAVVPEVVHDLPTQGEGKVLPFDRHQR